MLTIPDNIFRAYDIRGVVDKELSEAAMVALGQAFASEALAAGEQTVIVARDGRLSGPRLQQAFMQGVQNAGADVIDIGAVPTPVLYFATNHLAAKSGVMITGSHNPPEYNGVKMVIAGKTLFAERIQALKQRLLEGKLSQGAGKYQQQDLETAYIQRITDEIQLQRPLRVVVDCGNGIAGVILPKLLRGLGAEVIELFCEVDGNFPNHHPDPSQPENLQAIITAVAEQKADLGIAIDGDGDRLGVVTDKGDIIWPDRYMMLFAQAILAKNPGAMVVYDVKCSKKLTEVIEGAGGLPRMCCTGHSYVKNTLVETGALLAGEMSGHIFFNDRWYGFDDGLYSAARLLEIVSGRDEKVSEIFAALPDSVNTPELKIPMSDDKKFAFVETLAAEETFPEATINTLDGLRVEFPYGWGLVRASNTTPMLVLRFEADDAASLQKVQSTFKAALLRQDASLQLPF